MRHALEFGALFRCHLAAIRGKIMGPVERLSGVNAENPGACDTLGAAAQIEICGRGAGARAPVARI